MASGGGFKGSFRYARLGDPIRCPGGVTAAGLVEDFAAVEAGLAVVGVTFRSGVAGVWARGFNGGFTTCVETLIFCLGVSFADVVFIQMFSTQLLFPPLGIRPGRRHITPHPSQKSTIDTIS